MSKWAEITGALTGTIVGTACTVVSILHYYPKGSDKYKEAMAVREVLLDLAHAAELRGAEFGPTVEKLKREEYDQREDGEADSSENHWFSQSGYRQGRKIEDAGQDRQVDEAEQ